MRQRVFSVHPNKRSIINKMQLPLDAPASVPRRPFAIPLHDPRNSAWILRQLVSKSIGVCVLRWAAGQFPITTCQPVGNHSGAGKVGKLTFHAKAFFFIPGEFAGLNDKFRIYRMDLLEYFPSLFLFSPQRVDSAEVFERRGLF
jgi:hypothetical protein